MKVYQTLTKVLLVLLLTSCAHLHKQDYEYTWYMSERPVLPMRVVHTTQDVVKTFCNKTFMPVACAVFYKDILTGEWTECIVYTQYKNLPESVISHEKKHCDGWNHVED